MISLSYVFIGKVVHVLLGLLRCVLELCHSGNCHDVLANGRSSNQSFGRWISAFCVVLAMWSLVGNEDIQPKLVGTYTNVIS